MWQGRFSSFPMDEDHLITAAKYIELNPVLAKLVADPGRYPWSSAQAHLGLQDSGIINTQALLTRVPDWRSLLKEGVTEAALKLLEMHQRTGRPLGSLSFLRDLERL